METMSDHEHPPTARPATPDLGYHATVPIDATAARRDLEERLFRESMSDIEDEPTEATHVDPDPD